MSDLVFSSEQFVDQPRQRVFAFFSDPANLESITPPWLRFRILKRSTPEIGEGTEFTYGLSLRGLPMRWRSRIEEWQPGERFVDVQLSGPYAKWHHTHSFHDHGNGTLIRDCVRYRLPLGRLGLFLMGRFVASDVRRIFDFRAARVHELLAGEETGRDRDVARA